MKNPKVKVTKPETNVEKLTGKKQAINIEAMSGDKLAVMLNEQYERLMQAQNNITTINQTLEKRQVKTKG